MRATLGVAEHAESTDRAFAGLVFADTGWVHAEFDDIVSASLGSHSPSDARTGCGGAVTPLPRLSGTTSAVANPDTRAATAAPRARQRSPPHGRRRVRRTSQTKISVNTAENISIAGNRKIESSVSNYVGSR